MLLRCHRFSKYAGGEESITIPIPIDLEEDMTQGGFHMELMVDNGEDEWEEIWSVWIASTK